MSGFVGVLHADGAPVDTSLLRRITESMGYCGPDRQNVWLDGHVGLGHALLAPTAEAAGDDRQPSSIDERARIVADARIDGRGDLARRLDSPPEASDAQLILHAYKAWGERCVDHLVGDFAFAIWDSGEQCLFCARDHFGVVPLYYARVGARLLVGNVIKALRLHPAVSHTLNERTIGDVLLVGVNMDHASTAFADLEAVPPGHVLTWKHGAVATRRYWEPPEPRDEPPPRRPEEHVERFTSIFDEAVADRLRSNRAGAHLTGGMDSTSITATAHRVLASRSADFDLRAYTVVFDRLIAEEEGRYAKQVADRLGLPLEQLVADEYMTRPRQVQWAFPEPGMMAEVSALHDIGLRVASFARLLLAGIGGDPLMAPPSVRTSVWDALRRGRVPRPGIRTAIRRQLRGGPDVPPLPDWIDAGFVRRVGLSERWRELRSDWAVASDRRAMLNPLWAAIFAWSHPGAHGAPFRVVFPFFDLRLVECVWETPTRPWRQDKRLLREAMRGRLPGEILERPKTPLYVPRGRVHEDDPSYRLAQIPEVRQRGFELLSGGRIAEYVDVERAKARIESPVPRRTVPRFEHCFVLAHWLQSDLGTE